MNNMDFELYNAVISDDIEALTAIERSLSVVDQLTATEFTVLHLASQFGNLRCVKHILSAHESLLVKVNSRGETALHLAARGGHYDVAITLISAAKSSRLQHNHLQGGSSTVEEFLIRTANVEFETALHQAVRYNQQSVVKLLVTEYPSHPHPPNKNDETPLYLASFRGYKDIVSVILEGCVSPNYGGPDGRTALHAAILNGTRRPTFRALLEKIGDESKRRESVELLLEKRKELIKVADNYGWTAFHYVAHYDDDKMLDDLLAADKSVAYLADKKYKRTPLHVAAYRGSVSVMIKLMKYCPDSCSIVDGSGRNILHIAVKQDRKMIIEYISRNCNEIDNLLVQKDKYGNTPLHLMAMLGCYVPQVMGHNQLDLEALNDQNLTPLDVLHSTGNKYLADQDKIEGKLMKAMVKMQWTLGRLQKDSDYESRKVLKNYSEKEPDVEDYRKLRDAHMIVAALITTIAFTAGFSVPGGFDDNEGPKQGSPLLLHKAAFRAFVITDTIALLLSLSSLSIYLITAFYEQQCAENVKFAYGIASVLNVYSIVAMMVASITGTYAVLSHLKALAITASVISSFFFLFIYWFLNFRLPKKVYLRCKPKFAWSTKNFKDITEI